MSSSPRHRLLNQIAQSAAWSSSAWLAVMVGCVDAPQESFTPIETTAALAPFDSGLVQAELTESVATPAGQFASQVASEVEEPSPTGQVPETTPVREPTHALEGDGAAESSLGLVPVPESEILEAEIPEPVTEGESAGEMLATTPNEAKPIPAPQPSPATEATSESAPSETRLTPVPESELDETGTEPSLADAATNAGAEPATPAPFPVTGEPTPSLEPEPEEVEPTPVDSTTSEDSTEASLTAANTPAADVPVAAPKAGQPAVNANANPLEVPQPKGYIHLSPKHRTPQNSAIPFGTINLNIIGKPQSAVVLPPSSGADAASLAPLSGTTSAGNNSAAKSPTSMPTHSPATSGEPGPQLDTSKKKSSSVESSAKGIPVSPVSISSTESEKTSESEIPEGFTPLLNNQDMAGWEVVDGKPDSWQFQDGIISCTAPGGGWIQTLATYSDFELRFEYRLSPGGNSGVALRYPGHGNPSLEGLEIQLIDDHAEKYQDIQPQQATGSLYFAAAPQVRDAAQPAGTWNHCAVRCVGQRLEVTINDQLVNEIDLNQLNTKVDGETRSIASVRSPMGSIALQSHSTRVDFRQVVLRDLTQLMTSGVRWLDLQDGSGEPAPEGALVTVHYIGHLSTGKRFANSIEKAKPVTVQLKDVIPGWREGIPGMKVGGKRRLIVPPEMAYGAKGFKEVVPPNSTLVYEIELLEFEPTDEVPLESADAAPSDVEVK